MKLIRLGRRAPAISPGPIRFRDQAKLHNPKLGVTRDLANFGKFVNPGLSGQNPESSGVLPAEGSGRKSSRMGSSADERGRSPTKNRSLTSWNWVAHWSNAKVSSSSAGWERVGLR